MLGVAHRAFTTTAKSHNRHNPTCLGSFFNRGVKHSPGLLLDEDERWPPSSYEDHEQLYGAGGGVHTDSARKTRLEHPHLPHECNVSDSKTTRQVQGAW